MAKDFSTIYEQIKAENAQKRAKQNELTAQTIRNIQVANNFNKPMVRNQQAVGSISNVEEGNKRDYGNKVINEFSNNKIIQTLVDFSAAGKKGFFDLGEGIIDLGAGLIGSAIDLFGGDSTGVENFIKKDYSSMAAKDPLGIFDIVAEWTTLDDEWEDFKDFTGFYGKYADAYKDIVENKDSGMDWLDENLPVKNLASGTTQAIGQMVGIWLTGGIIGGASKAVGAGAKATKVAQTAALTAEFGGLGVSEALNEGANIKEATAYGLASGLAESAIEQFSAGAQKGISKGIGDKLTKGVVNKVTNNAAKAGLKIATDAFWEGMEEVASNYLSPVIKDFCYEHDGYDAPTTQENLEAFFSAALSSAIVGGARVASNGTTNYVMQDEFSDLIEKAEKLQQKYANGVINEAQYEKDRTSIIKEMKAVTDKMTEKGSFKMTDEEYTERYASDDFSAKSLQEYWFDKNKEDLQKKFGINEISKGEINERAYIRFDENGTKILVNNEQTDKISLLVHELTHQAEKSPTYNKLQESALKLLTADEKAQIVKGILSNKTYRDELASLGDLNGNLNEKQERYINEEITAIAIEKALGNEKMISQLSNVKVLRGLFIKIKGVLNKNNRILTQLEKALKMAQNEERKNTITIRGKKYSIKEFEDFIDPNKSEAENIALYDVEETFDVYANNGKWTNSLGWNKADITKALKQIRDLKQSDRKIFISDIAEDLFKKYVNKNYGNENAQFYKEMKKYVEQFKHDIVWDDYSKSEMKYALNDEKAYKKFILDYASKNGHTTIDQAIEEINEEYHLWSDTYSPFDNFADLLREIDRGLKKDSDPNTRFTSQEQDNIKMAIEKALDSQLKKEQKLLREREAIRKQREEKKAKIEELRKAREEARRLKEEEKQKQIQEQLEKEQKAYQELKEAYDKVDLIVRDNLLVEEEPKDEWEETKNEETLANSGILNNKIKKRILENRHEYLVAKNAKTQNEGIKRFESVMGQPIDIIMDNLIYEYNNRNKNITPSDIVYTDLIIATANEMNLTRANEDRLVELIEAKSLRMTELGQTIQANDIVNKIVNAGRIKAKVMERLVEKLNKQYESKKLTRAEEIRRFKEYYSGDSRLILQDIVRDIFLDLGVELNETTIKHIANSDILKLEERGKKLAENIKDQEYLSTLNQELKNTFVASLNNSLKQALKGVKTETEIVEITRNLVNEFLKQEKELIESIKTAKVYMPKTQLRDLANAKGEQAIRDSERALTSTINSQHYATVWEKITQFRVLAMLGNPKTHFRNIIGNTLMRQLVKVKDKIKIGLENIAFSESFSNEMQNINLEIAIANRDMLENTKEERDVKRRTLAELEAKREEIIKNNKFKISEKTTTLKSTVTKSGRKMYKYVLKNIFKEDYFDNSSKYEDKTEKPRVFKNKMLEKIRQKNYTYLSLEDNKAIRNIFAYSFTKYMLANNISLDTLQHNKAQQDRLDNIMEKLADYNKTAKDITNPPAVRQEAKKMIVTAENNIRAIEKELASYNRALDYSIQEAERATFHEASKLADYLNKIAAMNKIADIGVNSLIPFKKTPINIAKQGFRYSPLGLLKSITSDIIAVKQGKMDAAQLIDNISMGLTGSFVTVIGMILARCGIIRTGKDDDDEYRYNDYVGNQKYSLVIGDIQFTLDWAAPTIIPLFIGANLAESFETNEGILDTIENSMLAFLDPMTEMTMLQGVNNALNNYQDNKLGGLFAKMGENILTSFVPTFVSQFAKTVDPYRRDTTATKNNAIGNKNLQKDMNLIAAKVPFISMLLEPYVDIWGNEDKNHSGIFTSSFAINAVQNLAMPSYYSIKKSTPVDEEIQRLYVISGDGKLIPTLPNSYYMRDGERIDLTAKEYTAFKKKLGKLKFEALEFLIKQQFYKNLSDEEKQQIIINTYEKMTSYAKERLPKYDEYIGSFKNIYELNAYYLYLMSVDGGKSERVKAVNKLPITRQQRIALLKMLGYKVANA